jgi:2-polyprenyl-3-methyl-5-hydroxy-6-metoxy-1,4-benzoquinol methylase
MSEIKKVNTLIPRLEYNRKPELNLNSIQLKMKKRVEVKIEKGIYKFESLPCPICSSCEAKVIGQKDRYGLYYPTNICSECGLVYTSPRMSQESYNQFYNDEYRRLYGGEEKPNELFFNRQRIKGKRIYKFIQEHASLKRKNFSVLEVGCGAGGIIHYFKEQGCSVKGIDLGNEYISYGKIKHNLDLETGSLESLTVKNSPDVIIYSHVLEHILDINREVELINKISNEDTVVYIEVPGVKEIHKHFEMNILKYFQNAHTYHFTLESVKNLMAKNGFELIHGNQFVMSAFRKTKKDLALISDYQNTIDYIKKIESNRKYFLLTSSGFSRFIHNSILKLLDVSGTRSMAKKINSKF